MAVPRLDVRHTALLVVDVQEKLLPHMHNAQDVVRQAALLIDGANLLGLPVLVTEQYPKGLGPTVPPIAARIGKACLVQDKLKFSAFIEPVREKLVGLHVRSVLVCGIEAHVCILQTCLDLIDGGYVVALAHDAVGSRRAQDMRAALGRLTQAGVVPTTVESALLEMIREAGTPAFKAMLGLIK